MHEAAAAAAELAREGIEAAVLDARFVKPLDEGLLCAAAAWTGCVVTVEEAALAGGFGAACLEAFERQRLLDRGLRVRRLGLPDRFVAHGDPARQLSSLGLDAAGIARAVCALVGEARARPLRLADPSNPELATG